jgi:hypothetical protein
MFQFIDSIIVQFKPCFKTFVSWVYFACSVIGFIARCDARGISSVISCLRIDPARYTSLLKFFRSNTFDLCQVYKKYIRIFSVLIALEELRGKVILTGDHIKVSKEARRMPCVEKLHQESGNSGKAEYIEGHMIGFVSGLSQRGEKSIPLMGGVHESKANYGGDSSIQKMVKMAGEVAKTLEKPAILLLDAYFYGKTALQALAWCMNEKGEEQLTLIMRVKRNAVGYTEPSRSKKGKGRPRDYGEKVVLWDLFNFQKSFHTVTLMLYGGETLVRYLRVDLIQRPTKRRVRFVLTVIGGKKFILLCSDRGVEAREMIGLYAKRFKIEGMFGEMKNQMGGFGYHFWTGYLNKREPGEAAERVSERSARGKKVAAVKKAIEAYICFMCVAYTILNGYAIRQPLEIWGRFRGWLRTVRTRIPTIRVSKEVFSAELQAFLPKLGRYEVFREVSKLTRDEEFYYDAG